MTTIIDGPSVRHALRANRIVSAWAASGICDDYVVYERDQHWSFAGGRHLSIVLTAAEVVVDTGRERRSTSWTGSPARQLESVIATRVPPSARLFGWVGFDFCAAEFGLLGHIPRGQVLAHLIVPEFEATVAPEGVTIDGADERTETVLRAIAEQAADVAVPSDDTRVGVDLDRGAGRYRDVVSRAVDEIRAGRYRKVVLARQVEIPVDVDIPATYRRGRAANTPARSFLLRLDGLEAAGFSPELVAAVRADRTVVAEPLAGTRAFGVSEDLDRRARAELETDMKEIAEHALSVQTAFDEVAAVAEQGTTAVTDFMRVRERGSVQHLGSTVTGILSERLGPWDALAALFPSITASGTPKRAAVEAIYRYEGRPRGLYSGAVVTVTPEGDFEATLALRTVFRQNGRCWLQAGAGIVEQSEPEREFRETCEKLGSVAPYLVPHRPPAERTA